jgi:archaeal chaperonin
MKGLVLDKERVNSSMPKKLRNAKVALVDSPLEVKTSETEAKIQITDPSQLQAFVDQEEIILKGMVDKIVGSGASVLLCQKGIDDVAQYYLAKAGVMAIRRVKKSDMTKLSKATGAKIVNKISDLTSQDLGNAGLVEEKKVGEEEVIYVTECLNPKFVTVLLRGGTEHVVDELERAMVDSLSSLIVTLDSGKVVAGAGAVEMELSRQLREYATSLSGREQLAVLAFADSVEVVPSTLAENSGLDPIDVLTELKSKHNKGEKWAGIDVLTGRTLAAWDEGIIEPLKIKTQAIKSASEVAELILRIDDVIAGSGAAQPANNDQNGMPPGMSGMM